MSRASASLARSSVAAAAAGVAAIALTLVLAQLPSPASAQTGGSMQGGAWLLGALPKGEFKDKVEKNGFGVGGTFNYRIPQSPVYIGAELDFAVYGQAKYETLFAGLPVRVVVQTDNSILQGLLMLRLQPPTGAVRPYADGLFGFNYLFTTTTIQNIQSGDEVASDKNLDDTALAYGGGGGVMFRLWQREVSPEKVDLRAVFLDVRARYLVGAEAKYLKEGTIEVVNNQLVYRLQQSTTDLVTVGAGVTFEF